MSFPRYPAYKASGVEWLGEVPVHWALPKLKQLATFSGGGTPSRENLDYWSGDIPWVSPKDMKTERLTGAEESITPNGLANSSTSLVPPGRLLMVVRSGILKHTIPVAINSVEVALNQDMKALDFGDKSAASSFLLRWVQGLNDLLLLAWSKEGATVESLEHEYVANTVVPMPPHEELAAIAAFLDHETAKIDALVAEQERLIELLKEKRQAVISHAVTKGLDPSVPMKDSGVEWLGVVPAHWETTRLKHATKLIVDCPHETPTYSDEGEYLVIRTADIFDGVLCEDGLYRVSETEYFNRVRRQSLLQGDVVYGREGERWGHAALVPRSDTFCLGQRMMQFRVAKHFDPEYMMWLLNSEVVYRQGQQDTVGATSPHVNVGTIRNYALCSPPQEEQQRIGMHLSAKACEFDALIKDASAAISLLQERRTALISAAVTGQIDVCEVLHHSL